MRRRTRLLLVAAIVAATTMLPLRAGAEECHPDDGRPCCKTTAAKVNAYSQRLIGQDLMYCTQ